MPKGLHRHLGPRALFLGMPLLIFQGSALPGPIHSRTFSTSPFNFKALDRREPLLHHLLPFPPPPHSPHLLPESTILVDIQAFDPLHLPESTI